MQRIVGSATKKGSLWLPGPQLRVRPFVRLSEDAVSPGRGWAVGPARGGDGHPPFSREVVDHPPRGLEDRPRTLPSRSPASFPFRKIRGKTVRGWLPRCCACSRQRPERSFSVIAEIDSATCLGRRRC